MSRNSVTGHSPRPLVAALRDVVGSSGCLTDPEVTASFGTDWTGRFSGPAAAVVRPRSAREVAGVLEACRRHGAAVIPQGGNTGLVGGGVPRPLLATPQVVLSLSKMATVHRCDARAGLLEADAGVTLATAAKVASAAGCHLGIDLGARDSATLGGMLATNAGGIHVLRFGPMGSRVAGVEAVLADGSVLSHMSGLAKCSTGPNPVALLAGSEGTLAVVTRVLMRLLPAPAQRSVALVALRGGVEAAVRLVSGPLRAVAGLQAAELTLGAGMRLACERAGLPSPVGMKEGATAWLTLEAAGDDDPTEPLARALEDDEVIGAAVATAPAARDRLWAYREKHTEAIATLGIPHKLDVSVLPELLPELVGALEERIAAASPEARTFVFGHIAEGNVHVNVVGPAPEDDSVDEAVLRLVIELGGSISAEHGVGVAKRRWLSEAVDSGELEVGRRVKRALDPDDILNPGVLAPL